MKFIFIAIFLLWSGSSQAANACYNAKEAMAEKILRLHTELMVIAVSCKQNSHGRDLGKAYSRLTRVHLRPIKKAENILKAYFSKHYGGSGLNRLDKMRTKLANIYGQIVAKESAPLFCHRRRDRVTMIHDSRKLSFERESLRANQYIELLSPLCSKATQTAKNRRKREVWE